MIFPKPRTAWSVACGIAAVLMSLLWMRSYWRMDWVTVHCDSNFLAATSMTGAINFSFQQRVVPYWQVKFWSRDVPPEDLRRYSALTFLWNSDINLKVLVVPHWLLAAILATGTACYRIRFSLRTLLIATTVVAVLLGTIVWATN